MYGNAKNRTLNFCNIKTLITLMFAKFTKRSKSEWMRFSIIFLFVILSIQINAQIEQLTLPLYKLEIEPEYLEELYNDPLADKYFPALFSFDDNQYDCEVKFRGATALLLPKKSWKIKFEDTNNVFNAEKINLNSEFRDRTLMRNYLTMQLYQDLGYQASNTHFISFIINDVYMGVFVHIEEVDENFLERNGKSSNDMFKAKEHGANMTQIVNCDGYSWCWESKIKSPDSYKGLQTLFSKFSYWSKEDFDGFIETEVDVDNILNYFAIEYSITSLDCFTKNFFFYLNPVNDKYEMFPWDNDATFGNDWQGFYTPSFIQSYKISHLNNQILFRRLIENDNWQNEFWLNVQNVTSEGFSYMHQLVDSIYLHIKNDIYLDTNKICSNSEFDDEIQLLHTFITERTNFLNGVSNFNIIPLTDFYCSNPLPSDNNPEIVFRVKSNEPQDIFLHYSTDLDMNINGCSFTIESLELFDDGNHNDLLAGDSTFGNILEVATFENGVIPFCFNASGFDYQYNGFFASNLILQRTNSFAWNKISNNQNTTQQIEIEEVYKFDDEYFIKLHNNSSITLDLSYCYIQSGQYYQKFILPENTFIEGNSNLFIATNRSFANNFFEGNPCVGNLFFDILIDDTVKLLSPTFFELSYKICEEYSPINYTLTNIIINEINYHSADDFNTGDWIELYNSENFVVDLSGWILKDEDDSHSFTIPEGTLIDTNGFLVLCENLNEFTALNPQVLNCIGDLGFGLSGNGELIRLYNFAEILIDSLTYDDEAPWPTEPDGNGPTLELINPELNNSLPESWMASFEYGTPGESNTLSGTSDSAISFFLNSKPNPFKTETIINYSISVTGNMQLFIYDVYGQLVGKLVDQFHSAGSYSIKWRPENCRPGLFIIDLRSDNITVKTLKIINIK